MRPATQSPGENQDAGCRVEREISRALLGLVGVTALWWAGSWWWRAAHAEVAPAPRPPVDTAIPPAPPHVDRRRALTLGGIRTTGADAGALQALTPAERPLPQRVSYGMEQGHGSESWSSSDAPGREDFEPRYSLDGGTFATPPPVTAEAPGAFH
jgi:hypothetical protein